MPKISIPCCKIVETKCRADGIYVTLRLYGPDRIRRFEDQMFENPSIKNVKIQYENN